MKKFHPLSFVLGLASGLLILVFVVGGTYFFRPAQPAFGNYGGSGNGPNLARMAQRFGMTQDELQKELDSGKTIQQIATEHGVQFTGRRRGGSGSSLSTASSNMSATSTGSLPAQPASASSAQ